MSITIGRFVFEGPSSSTGSLRNQSGVYAIMTPNGQQTESWDILDIGESGDVRHRIENHDRKDCWQRYGNGSLHCATLYCSATDRTWIESELRTQFTLPCGVG